MIILKYSLIAIGFTSSFRISRLQMNIMDKFGGMFNSKSTTTETPTIKFVDTSMPWEEINSRLKTLEKVEEREKFDAIASGRGYSNHKANLRLFDAPDGFTPEVTLYRDTAGNRRSYEHHLFNVYST